MRALLDLVMPAQCPGCGARGVLACAACLAALTAPARPAWPSPSPPGLPPPFAVSGYAGPVRALLLAYKEDDCVGLRRPLGSALAMSLRAALTDAASRSAVVVPVPSTRAARRRRGRDVVADLAGVAAACVRADGGSVRVARVLRHRRSVADSAGLTAAQRAANLRDAFAVRPGTSRLVTGRQVVVVDDLVTTGVTLAECAASLRRAGAEVVACATVAATTRRRTYGTAQRDPGALRSG